MLQRAAGVVVLVLAIVCASTTRAAAGDDVEARARSHFEKGVTLYKAERYAEALKEFESGYALAPRPRFLVSIGQCHRRLGALSNARDAFRRFLAAVPQDDPVRPQVVEMLREVDAAIGATDSTDTSSGPPPMLRPTQEPPPPAVVALDRPGPRREEPHVLRRHGWTIAIGVAVVTAVGVGVYLATQTGGGCRSEDLSCLDLR